MKKIISITLAAVIAAFSVIPVFAAENDELTMKTKEFQDYVTECESYYIYYDYMTPPDGPFWSTSSNERMTVAVEEARNAVINTEDELEMAKADFDQVVSTMTLDKEELEFMIYLFEKENNGDNYYDEETWNRFQSVLADGKLALESGDEEAMYCAYIKMRNEFNNICTYNTEYGDFNGDGSLSVTDITFAQKYLAGLEKFNYSQLTIAQFNYWDFLTVADLTNLQKYLVGTCEKMRNSHLEAVLSLEELDVNTRKFTPKTENSNFIYKSERSNYFNNCNL